MKKLLLLCTVAAAFVSISACSFVNQAQVYVEKHCPHTEYQNPTTGKLEIRYECDSLWPTSAIQGKCSAINICIDAANGKISGEVKCDNLVKVPVLLKKAHVK